jgi:hypothetical protein
VASITIRYGDCARRLISYLSSQASTMILVLQFMFTAAAYAAVAWAIGGHFRELSKNKKLAPPGKSAWRRPWLSYGILITSAGLFLMMSEVALSGFGNEPHPVTLGVTLLTILAGRRSVFMAWWIGCLFTAESPSFPRSECAS